VVRYIHDLGKESRLSIIYILLQNRSKKELADELEVSPALITKYLKGITHPSDEIIKKCIEISNEEEYKQIIDIIISDLSSAVEELINDIDVEYILQNESLKKLYNYLNKIYNQEYSTSSTFV